MSSAPSPLRIAIAGAAGRMGQALVRAAGPDFAVAGGTERPDSADIGRDIGEIATGRRNGSVLSGSVQEAIADADVWIDFTSPKATLAALDQLVGSPVKAAVIGTTGLSDAEEALVRAHGSHVAIVRAGNFSLGVNLLLALVEQAAARLGPDWDIEISETHHRRKADAPSGTALMIGEAAAAGRKQKLADLKTPPYDGLTGPRQAGSIGFSVSRAGSVIGDHEARFASDEEILILGHRALDRAVFARGALKAAQWAADKTPGYYTMRDVLDI